MKLDFGTAGIRGIVGDGIEFLNEIHVARVFDAYARYLIDNIKDAKKRGIVIGRDNRIKGKIFSTIAYKILTSYGIKVIFNNKMLATPFISYLTRKRKAAGAINITASHNPKEYNGIKLYDENGCQLLPKDVNLLKKYFKNYYDYQNFLLFDYENEIKNFKNDKFVLLITENDYNDYVNEILKINFDQQNLTNIKIVYSSLHGTGYDFIKRLFDKEKTNLYYEQNEIIEDENFSYVKNPNPESKLAFTNTINLLNEKKADIILVTDPDSDRVGVVIKNNDDYILLNGNETAILITEYLINYKKRDDKEKYYLIYSFVSTSLPSKMCLENNIESYITETGFKWIGNKIDELSKQNKKFFFAFEESFGSLIIDDLVHDKDAIQALYVLAIIASKAKEKNQSLLDQLDNIYKKYGYMNAKSMSFDLKDEKQLKNIQEKFKNLNFENAKFIDYNDGISYIEPSNMYTYLFNDNLSWVSLRPSGTEPKIKLYIHIINKDKQKSIDKFNKVLNEIKKIFN